MFPSTTRAEIEKSAVFTGASDVTLSASSDHTATTTAENGAAATSGTGVGISAAIAIVNDDTHATIGTGGTLDLSGSLSGTATHTGKTVTTAGAKASGDNAAGIGIAVNVVSDWRTPRRAAMCLRVGR